MPQFVARFLSFVLLAAAFAPLTARAEGKYPMTEAIEFGLLLADILLAASGIILVVVGLVGLGFLRTWARRAAEETANKYLAQNFSEEKIKERINEAVLKQGKPQEPDTATSPDRETEKGK